MTCVKPERRMMLNASAEGFFDRSKHMKRDQIIEELGELLVRVDEQARIDARAELRERWVKAIELRFTLVGGELSRWFDKEGPR